MYFRLPTFPGDAPLIGLFGNQVDGAGSDATIRLSANAQNFFIVAAVPTATPANKGARLQTEGWVDIDCDGVLDIDAGGEITITSVGGNINLTPDASSGIGLNGQVSAGDDIVFGDSGEGVVLKSPGGSFFRTVVSDLGVLTTVAWP
jgi:hypothetical protein